jgi:hypothetical protein
MREANGPRSARRELAQRTVPISATRRYTGRGPLHAR